MAAGTVEAVIFAGRQLGHSAAPGIGTWWGWLGVWPVAAGLALTTLAVILFPDGRPLIGAIFTKLRLDPDSASNRRVLAVLAFLRV